MDSAPESLDPIRFNLAFDLLAKTENPHRSTGRLKAIVNPEILDPALVKGYEQHLREQAHPATFLIGGDLASSDLVNKNYQWLMKQLGSQLPSSRSESIINMLLS